MNLRQPIETLEYADLENFNHRYYQPQKPVVIKGLVHDTLAGKRWSIRYFKEEMGDLEIDVFDNANKKSASSAFTKPDLKMKFADFLNIISKNEKTNLRIFLFNFFKSNPNLRAEFPCPALFKGILGHMGYMFFGGKDTTVRIHYDVDMSNVLLTHFGGRKKVVLIAPEYSDLLYCLPLNTYSLIDHDKIDLVKYPALAYVKGYECVLEHGDSIFMPSGYWHYMTYLDCSFSISYRKLAPTFQSKLAGLINLAIKMPLDKLLGKIIGENWLVKKEYYADKKATQAINNLPRTKEIKIKESYENVPQWI